jgi:uncharacterized protein YndB with AHSA1/START domain/DNA-binding transcriptional ArsR family regulator
MSDDPIFRALADPSRRLLLDRLFERDGRSLKELEARLEMTRFGVMKHLHVLEEAGLVTTRKVGREKLHFLNPVPIQLLYDRWIGKYAAPRLTALADLKAALEGDVPVAIEAPARPRQVYQLFIKATPERVWEAMTNPELTTRYFGGPRVFSDLTIGSPFNYLTPEGTIVVEGEVVESDPPRRLVHTWRATWNADTAQDAPSRVTWELDAQGEGMTRLTVVHDEFDGETATYRETSSGWSWVLSNLKTLLETGDVLPSHHR